MRINVNIKGSSAGALVLVFVHVLRPEAKGLLFSFYCTIDRKCAVQGHY